MAFNIGFFKATDTGFTGKIDTLAITVQAGFHRVLDRTHENAPAYEIFCGDLKIGAAWERQGQKGVPFRELREDPGFSSGYYNLYKSSIENGHVLTFERPKAKQEEK